MLAAKLRYQGLLIAGLFFLVMFGSFAPDPFVDSTALSFRPLATQANVFKSAYEYFRYRMKYVASAPLVRSIVGYNLNSSLSPRVYIGRNHHLYYALEDTTAQSAGDVYRRPEVMRFVDIAAVLQRELRKDGADLVVAIPPNAQSVAIEDLPFRPRGKLREYDLALAELKNRGIKASDIRSALLAYGDGNALYKSTDTHWNNHGSLLAFNSVVTDAGHPQWTIPTSALGPTASFPGGDLAELLGIQLYTHYMDSSIAFPPPDRPWESVSILRSPPFRKGFESHSYEKKGAGGGERVLILGDSFTQGWPSFFKSAVGLDRIGWLHHSLCGFDFEDVRLFKPTLVIWMPVERSMPCALDRWPNGLPEK